MSGSTPLSQLRAWKTTPGAAQPLQAVALPEDVRSLDQASAHLPAGAYTTFRTFFADKALRLPDHIARLEDSAARAGKRIALDETAIRQAIRAAIAGYRACFHQEQGSAEQGQPDDVRVRLTLALENGSGELFLIVDRLVVPPPTAYQQGVPVLTAQMKRNQPEAKLTSFIDQSSHVRQAQLTKVNEVLMVDEDGWILEGISSNFFAVRDGAIWTAGAGVLLGITRAQVVELADKCALPVHFEAVHISHLPLLDEAFISSSSRGVLPVCQVDQQRIGNGDPGPLTVRLMQAYARAIAEQAEPV